MAFEILFAMLLVVVILGITGAWIYNQGLKKGKLIGSNEEAARWKASDTWKVDKAEKHT